MLILGLLHIDERESINYNLKSENPLDVYLRNAVLLARSVGYHGLPFQLITNNRAFVTERLAALHAEIPQVKEVQFSLQVPKAIPFHGAHFKLDLFRMVGERQFGDSVGVIDIDAVMLAPPDLSWLAPSTLLFYDITSQMITSLGAERMAKELRLLSGVPTGNAQWVGTEFLCGSWDGFRSFFEAVQQVWPTYCREYKNVHVSDETVASAALHRVESLQLIDGGARRAIARWWTARTDHRQIPLAELRNASVLHLPSDKPFLAEISQQPFSPDAFFASYQDYAKRKLRGRRVANWLDRLQGKRARYVGQLE